MASRAVRAETIAEPEDQPIGRPSLRSASRAWVNRAAVAGCHDVIVVRPHDAAMRRRTFLSVVGGAAALTIASTVTGCSLFGSNDGAPTVVRAPAVSDPITGLIATTRLHILRLEAAIAAYPDQAALLTPLRDDRAAQLAALEAEDARVNPPGTGASSSATSSAPASGQVTVPPSPAAAISSIRGDAATAQVQFTDAVSNASRYRAALYGSIAASLASHRAILA